MSSAELRSSQDSSVDVTLMDSLSSGDFSALLLTRDLQVAKEPIAESLLLRRGRHIILNHVVQISHGRVRGMTENYQS